MIAKAICKRCQKKFEYDVWQNNGRYCSKECKKKPFKKPLFRYKESTEEEKDCRVKQEFNRLTIKNENSCWGWRGSKYPNGYTRMGCIGRPMGHRVSWIIHFGPIPNDKIVCHKCDNRECCNPDHLFLGTQSDNLHDMHTKNRGMKGENHINSKLCTNQVLDIKKQLKQGLSYSTISKKFNVSIGTIGAIKRNRIWKHIKIED